MKMRAEETWEPPEVCAQEEETGQEAPQGARRILDGFSLKVEALCARGVEERKRVMEEFYHDLDRLCAVGVNRRTAEKLLYEVLGAYRLTELVDRIRTVPVALGEPDDEESIGERVTAQIDRYLRSLKAARRYLRHLRTQKPAPNGTLEDAMRHYFISSETGPFAARILERANILLWNHLPETFPKLIDHLDRELRYIHEGIRSLAESRGLAVGRVQIDEIHRYVRREFLWKHRELNYLKDLRDRERERILRRLQRSNRQSDFEMMTSFRKTSGEWDAWVRGAFGFPGLRAAAELYDLGLTGEEVDAALARVARETGVAVKQPVPPVAAEPDELFVELAEDEGEGEDGAEPLAPPG